MASLVVAFVHFPHPPSHRQDLFRGHLPDCFLGFRINDVEIVPAALPIHLVGDIGRFLLKVFPHTFDGLVEAVFGNIRVLLIQC